MPETLIWEKAFETRREALVVDIVTKHEPTFETVVTDNPMEEGIDTSDHAVRRPNAFQLEAIVSDVLEDGTAAPGRARAALETLEELMGGTLLDVMVPGQGLRENVFLVRVSTSFTVTEGEGFLRFTAGFRAIRFGQSQQVPAPARKEPKTKPKKDDGYKAPALTYAHTADRSRTLLRRYVVDQLADRSRSGD